MEAGGYRETMLFKFLEMAKSSLKPHYPRKADTALVGFACESLRDSRSPRTVLHVAFSVIIIK